MAVGGESLLDMGEPRVDGGGTGVGDGASAAGEAPAPDLPEADSDEAGDHAHPGQAGAEIRKARRAPNSKITRADCARAIILAGGDYAVAAASLGITENALRLRVSGSQQLSALFQVEPKVPTATTVLERDAPPEQIDRGENVLADLVSAQNRMLMRQGLLQAGIKQTTIDKLRVLEGMATNAGEFLVASLDMTHRMMILQGVRLFEEAERIKTDYLDDATLDDEIKIQWQGAYNDICDQIGKCFDRTLVGTQALAKLLGTDKEDKKKVKPGFKPLKRVEKPHG